MNTLVITDTTAVRMNVIADRTQNLLVAGAKAMMIENLKEKLRNGVAHFVFIKKWRGSRGLGNDLEEFG